MPEQDELQPTMWPGPVAQPHLPGEVKTGAAADVASVPAGHAPRYLGVDDPLLIDLWKRETPVELLTYLSAQEHIGFAVIACAGAPDIKVPREHTYLVAPDCWGELSPALPAMLLAFGADQIKIFRCPRCQDNTPRLWSLWSALYGEAVEFCDCAGKFSLRRASCISIANAPLPRRMALGLGALEKPPFEFKDVDEVTRFNNARKYLRESAKPLFIDSLDGDQVPKKLAVADPHTVEVLDEYVGPLPYWGNLLDVNPQLCVSCPVCSRGCPSGALKLVTSASGSEEVTTLVHLPQLCRSCEKCIELCPHDALSSSGRIPWRKGKKLPETPRALNRQHTHNCKICGFKIPVDQGELCEHCRYRQENPFGFRLPPGMEPPAGSN